jgi:pimeloyl-ACP methyl ester carboxylesterase
LYLENGSVVCRYFDASPGRRGVIWLGGVSGGFDSPAHDLFDRLAGQLVERGIGSLRVRYRVPSDLETSVADALVAAEFLEQRGVDRTIFIGHAFGGAVAIQAGGASGRSAGVAALASQSFGTSGANRVSPRPLLLIHGEQDTVLPPECSRYIYDNALEPKRLILLPNAGHSFDECADELGRILDEFIADTFDAAADQPAA